MENKICKNCGQEFQITDKDQKFYKKMSVPEPTHCPDCRQQRRLSHENQIHLFKRKCDATGKDIISNFPQTSPYKVYDQKYWYSDEYDDTQQGRDYDFSRPFFEQFDELSREVPRSALFTDFLHDDNSQYTHCAGRNRNCYLIFDSDENWDCMYSYGMNSSKSSLDCYRVQKLELCYEVVDCKNCYNCAFVYKSENCSDSAFLNNCIGCKYCVACSNLKNKQYYLNNKESTKEEIEKYRKMLGSYEFLQKAVKFFDEHKLKFPQKYMHGFQNENCTGNCLVNCKNAINCFDSMNIWDGKYCYRVFISLKDAMDATECGESELIYESNIIAYNGYNIRFSLLCPNQDKNLTCCTYCFRCNDCLGCVGLKKKQFCILNKQYTKEEYEKLVPKIIDHMTKTGEWGEFFPTSISPHPYNLSVAQQYFPLKKEEALAKGHKWQDPDKKEYQPQTYQIPDNIDEVKEDITEAILACDACGKNYKIMPPEYRFYKRQKLPIPRKCFHCRHQDRFSSRPPQKLFKRTCQKCSIEIETAYAPDRPEIVYCEKCYLQSLV